MPTRFRSSIAASYISLLAGSVTVTHGFAVYGPRTRSSDGLSWSDTTVDSPGPSGGSAAGVASVANGDDAICTVSGPVATGPALRTVTFT